MEKSENIDAATAAESGEKSAKPAPEATPDAPEGRSRGSGARDVPISTVVHLMGLPTAKQLELLESKVDAVASRMQLVQQRVDRIATQLNQALEAILVDRIETQLTEIRALLKKVFPKGSSSEHPVQTADDAKGVITGKRMTLSSGGKKPSATGSEEEVKGTETSGAETAK